MSSKALAKLSGSWPVSLSGPLSSIEVIDRTTRQLAKALIKPPSVQTFPLPRIRATCNRSSARPTAWFICPDYDQPSGGIRKLYRFVDILNAAGIPSSILHARSGFSCSWFAHRTAVTSTAKMMAAPDDVFVIPEVYRGHTRSLPPRIRQIIINQNAYITLRTLSEDPANASSYIDNPNLAAVLTVSQDNFDVLSYLFPNIPLCRLRLGIDPAIHYPPSLPKQRRIVYMPRKRLNDASLVLDILRRRDALEGWEVIAIEKMSEESTANLLRSAAIFLSFSSFEGFGLPPLEAIACGCRVIGYHGFGGREYFKAPYATAIEDGDAVSFARTVETCIRNFESRHDDHPDIHTDTIRDLMDNYTLEAERLSIVEAFMPHMKA